MDNIIDETKFVECEYPLMGVEASNGIAHFEDQDQADELLIHLRKDASYYYAYVLEWKGPGSYIVKPEYRYDHDNEVIYTARFVKEIR